MFIFNKLNILLKNNNFLNVDFYINYSNSFFNLCDKIYYNFFFFEKKEIYYYCNNFYLIENDNFFNFYDYFIYVILIVLTFIFLKLLKFYEIKKTKIK